MSKCNSGPLLVAAVLAGFVGGMISQAVAPSWLMAKKVIVAKEFRIVDNAGIRGSFAVWTDHAGVKLFPGTPNNPQVELIAHDVGESRLTLEGTAGELSAFTVDTGGVSLNIHDVVTKPNGRHHTPLFYFSPTDGDGAQFAIKSRTHPNARFVIDAWGKDGALGAAIHDAEGNRVWHEKAPATTTGH